MMHGFGDDPNPYSETVDLVEELVVQFITEMTVKAMEVGKSGRVHVNDIIFIIRKDPKKYSRVKDLLTMKEQICLLYTSPSPRDATLSRMPSSA